jgi:cytochrome c oxidase subunit 4
VFFISAGVIAAAFAIFAFTRMFASPIRPRTMTKEWQEATEEYMKVRETIHLFCQTITNTP